MTKPSLLLVTTDRQLVTTFRNALNPLGFDPHQLKEVPSPEILAQPWQVVVVDAEMPMCEPISLLCLARSYNPVAQRGLVFTHLEPQDLIRAINEAQVHHLWKRPVTERAILKALQQPKRSLDVSSFALLLSAAIESKGLGHYGHGSRVAHYAMAIGHQLGLTEEQLRALKLGCFLHDVGKLLLPEPVSRNEGATEERGLEQQHPVLGEQLLQELALPEEVRAVIRYHHERWDGCGYPDQLRGEEIPLLAQIAALANRYDHLTAPSLHRSPLKHGEINAYFLEEAGRSFAPQVVEAFLRLRESREVWEIVDKITDLPALAPIVAKALTVLEREDFDWLEVAEILVQDPPLVAQLLRLANSAMTGLRRRVTSLLTALKVLGARAVRNLLLTLSVRPFLQVPAELRLWEHAIACALVARWLAHQTNLVDPEEAFTAGLLHDLGKSLLYRFFPESYQRVLHLAHLQGCPTFLVERLIFTVTHGEIGAWLLMRWRLPSLFCDVVADHHHPHRHSSSLAWHLFWANRLLRGEEGEQLPMPPEVERWLPSSFFSLFGDTNQLLKTVTVPLVEIQGLLDE